MPDTQLTLKSLLSLKVRRERGIRSAIARLEKQHQEIETRKATLLQNRRMLWNEWRQCSSSEQTLGPLEMRAYRAQLGKYYQQDHDLLAEVENADNELSQLQVEQDKQQHLLRQILLQQEKLKILME